MKQAKKPEFKIFGNKEGVVWGAVQVKGDYPHPVQREAIVENIPRAEFTMHDELPAIYGAFLRLNK
jgi:hypothetical protein